MLPQKILILLRDDIEAMSAAARAKARAADAQHDAQRAPPAREVRATAPGKMTILKSAARYMTRDAPALR